MAESSLQNSTVGVPHHGQQFSPFWPVIAFSDGLCLMQESDFVGKKKDRFSSLFRMQLELCWFREVEVDGSLGLIRAYGLINHRRLQTQAQASPAEWVLSSIRSLLATPAYKRCYFTIGDIAVVNRLHRTTDCFSVLAAFIAPFGARRAVFLGGSF